MSYASSGLNPGAENCKGGAFISTYVTVDNKAAVETANYFDGAAEQLNNSAGQGVLIVIDTATPITTIYGYQSTISTVVIDVAKELEID